VRLDAALAAADFCVTGEGRLDEQTLEGKVVAEVAGRCASARVPCHAVVGTAALGAEAFGLASVREAGDPRALEAAGLELALELRQSS
jgi:glycerate kinase